MKKIIIKSALTTLGIVIGCAVVVFAILSLGFPATVASWSYNLGNNGIAAKYAALYYSYTGETEDLATCALYAISSDKDSYIIEYCEKLIDCDDFSDYCEEYDTNHYGIDFRQYIYSKLAQACYSSGDLQRAIGTAVEAVAESYEREQYVLGENINVPITCFPVTNALGSLALVIDGGDNYAAEYLLNVFENIQTCSNTEQQYFETCKTYLEKIAS